MAQELIDTTFTKILNHYGKNLNPSQIPEPHRTAILVLHAHGIIGNGGFPYLFEGDFPGDPEFLLTRQAFRAINATNASAAFQKAFAVFPNSTPPNEIDDRLQLWQSKYTLRDAIRDETSPDGIYFNAMDETMRLLERYIICNELSFDSLD
jgi:hypothetical protein